MLLIALTSAFAAPLALPLAAVQEEDSHVGRIELHLLSDSTDRARGRRKLSGKTRKALRGGLDWLLAHQSPEGHWDADEFSELDPPDDRCSGEGQAIHDVGVTGLSVLALLAVGELEPETPDRTALDRGLDWLLSQTNEKGQIGKRQGHMWVYGQAIATLALAEAIAVAGREDLRETAQKSVDFIEAARNPYGVWRYDVPPNGDQDMSVTAWMTLALVTAKEAGLAVDERVFSTVLDFVFQMTNEEIGRIGYDTRGSFSARINEVNDDFPSDSGEAMTAAGFICEELLELRNKSEELIEKQIGLLERKPPSWNPGAYTIDQYYWYYGTLAMHQVAGKRWRTWQKGLERALLEGQDTGRGSAAGSWEPAGAWGFAGGRVYSTAIAVLTLATPARYEVFDE